MISPIEHVIAWVSRGRARHTPGPDCSAPGTAPAPAPDGASRASLPFIVLAGVCVASGGLVGTSLAAWSDSASDSGRIYSGISAFMTRNTPMNPDDINEQLGGNPIDNTTVDLTQDIPGDVGSGETAITEFYLDARQEGHRGMSVWITGVNSTDLTRRATARLYWVPTTQDCEQLNPAKDPDIVGMYTGALAEFTEKKVDGRPIVPAEYGVGNEPEANGHHKYCVVFTNDTISPINNDVPATLTFGHATYRKTPPPAPPRFRFTVDTSICGTAVLPIKANASGTTPVKGTIDWGDGTSEQTVSSEPSHTYTATDNRYTVDYRGTFGAIDSMNRSEAACLISVNIWGETGTTSMEGAFYGAKNLRLVDSPPSTVTTMKEALRAASSFDQSSLNDWNVSNVTDMTAMFHSASKFNGALDQWDTSKVTLMTSMFQNASAFNQPIESWDTSRVVAMNQMFYSARRFNQSLNGWDTNAVATMNDMFRDAFGFNGAIGDWRFAEVKTMSSMFRNATSFNQDISGWTFYKVTNMDYMFFRAENMWGDLSQWNVTDGVSHTNFALQSPVKPPSAWTSGPSPTPTAPEDQAAPALPEPEEMPGPPTPAPDGEPTPSPSHPAQTGSQESGEPAPSETEEPSPPFPSTPPPLPITTAFAGGDRSSAVAL